MAPRPSKMNTGRLPSFPGRFYWRHGRSGPVAVGWPKKRGKKISPKQAQAMLDLTNATLVMKYLDPAAIINATKLAGRGIVLPRDLLLMMLYGRLWTVGIADHGWVYSMASLIDMSALLDMFEQTPGSLLFRASDFWDGLPPGPEGYRLQMNAEGLPEWLLPPPVGSGFISGFSQVGFAPARSTTAFATKGCIVMPDQDIEISDIVYGFDANGGAQTIAVTIAHLDAFTSTAAIDAIVSGPTTPVSRPNGPGIYAVPPTVPTVLQGGEPYLIALSRTGGLGTAINHVLASFATSTGYRMNAPLELLPTAVLYNTVALSVAQTPSSTLAGFYWIWIEGLVQQ
jgi:hypothetical protein